MKDSAVYARYKGEIVDWTVRHPSHKDEHKTSRLRKQRLNVSWNPLDSELHLRACLGMKGQRHLLRGP